MDIALLTTDSEAWSFGLRSISATLRNAGHHTRLIFMGTNEPRFSRHHLDEIASLTRHIDLVGVSCLAQGSEKAKQVIEFLHLQKKLIVWGGIHASLNPAECADWAEIVCSGEGEGMMLDLVERLERGSNWSDIENIAYLENGSLQQNGLRPPIQNLDELPLPDFSFEDEYHLTKKGFIQVSTLPEMRSNGRILFNSSRGCAFHCTYCCNAKIKNLYSRKDRYIRRMSISKLIEHAQNLQTVFPLGTCFYFIDEDFAARPVAELVQFANEYPQKIGLPFECLTHPVRVTHQKMELLVKAGLYRMNMGIESGSERTKKEIFDRHVSSEVVKQAAEIISCYPQVVPKYFFIIANPYEEREDLLDTARLIASLPPHSYIQTYNLVFFPGSDLYERAIQEGLIKDKHESGYELDFLGGLHYTRHTWKKKNLYLNGLIYLMEGTTTHFRVGSLPRFILDILLHPHHIEFHEKYPFAIKWAVSIQLLLLKFIHLGGRLYRKITGKPTAMFNSRFFLRKKPVGNIST